MIFQFKPVYFFNSEYSAFNDCIFDGPLDYILDTRLDPILKFLEA